MPVMTTPTRNYQTAIALREYQEARDRERFLRSLFQQMKSAAVDHPDLDEPLRISREEYAAAIKAVEVAEATALALATADFVERMQTEFNQERAERIPI